MTLSGLGGENNVARVHNKKRYDLCYFYLETNTVSGVIRKNVLIVDTKINRTDVPWKAENGTTVNAFWHIAKKCKNRLAQSQFKIGENSHNVENLLHTDGFSVLKICSLDQETVPTVARAGVTSIVCYANATEYLKNLGRKWGKLSRSQFFGDFIFWKNILQSCYILKNNLAPVLSPTCRDSKNKTFVCKVNVGK